MAADRRLSTAAMVIAVGVAGAFLVLDAAGSIRLDVARAGGIALVSTATMVLAAAGAGGALLSRLAPALLDGEDSGLFALGVGLLLWGLGGLGLALFGGLGSTGVVGLAALLAAGWLARPALQVPRLPPLAQAAIGVVIFVGLIDALAPPIETDELYYHLALPAKMLREGGLVGGVLEPDGSRPMILHLPMTCLLLLGSDIAPRLLHLVLTVAMLMGCVSIGRRHLSEHAGVFAALALAGSWSIVHEAGLASNNLPAAFAVLLALDASLRGQRIGLVLLLGLAMSIKYTAAGAAAGLILAARISWTSRLMVGVGVVSVVAPWWLVNLGQGLHPLFPFAGWSGDVSFEYLEKYGFGRQPIDLLLLPWRAVMSAEIRSFRLLGRISPLLLAMLPVSLWHARRDATTRRLLLVSVVAGVVWVIGPHWLRYLLPALPVIALASAAGVERLSVWGQRALLGCLIVGLPANLGPLLPRLADRLPVATGQESEADYLSRVEDTWPAMSWANEQLPEDATVALLYTWSGYLLERDYVLGSVEDHIPVRHWLLTHQEASLSDLRDAGVTHVIVGRIGFLHKTYSFLPEGEFQSEFLDPLALLEELLLREAVLIQEANGVRIYRLPVRKNTLEP
ncbi:MAG: hypothetical protein P8R54_16170 [Myxococcota bacterium]|nr:hypothetical protein [Myxococcota bacterium]